MNKLPKELYSDLLGIPFKYNGRTKEEGLDCLGLMLLMCVRLNISMPDHPSVIDRKLREAALEKGKEMFKEIKTPSPGSFVSIRVAGLVAHIGIMLDNIRFLHIQRHKTVCIEKINDLKWKSRLDGFYIFSEREK